VWVDLTNSPHALFFAPIVRALKERGDEVLVTARRFAHTVELAEKLFDDPRIIGSGERKKLTGKVTSLGDRVRALMPVVRAFAPDVAVAHGSYDQPITARLLRIPDLAMVDYEHHPGTHLLFRLANRLLLPEPFVRAHVNSHGGRGKTWRYYGLKEEVYLADFRPDPGVLAGLGVENYDGRIVTLRPPAVGAMYHRDDNPIWTAVVDHLRELPDTMTFVLPRHPSQVPVLTEHVGSDTVRVLDHAIDGPALIWQSDAVISAGGTMNREAVVLGVPVWTMFSGRLGSVDEALIASGRMGRLTSPDDVAHLDIPRREKHVLPAFENDVRGQVIRAIERTAGLRRERV
jgi:predicted glycosyltransferase